MNGKDLFEGMSFVDERFVEEAESMRIPKQTVAPWIKITSMAACLCLVLFGLHSLMPDQSLEDSELNLGMASGAEAAPGEGAESEMPQESQTAPTTPAYGAAGEVPSLILRVDQITETGFVGTVAELVDTDIFEIGMELNVVFADGTRHETADGTPPMTVNSTTGDSSSYVKVQFIEYNENTRTIVVNLIEKTDSPEAIP